MSINPASSIVPIADAESMAVRARHVSSQQPSGAARGSDSGRDPKREIPVLRAASQPVEMPQDEVQVQRDSETNNAIVIRYVDGSGHLILQVPSSQVLNLERAIAQTFEEQASSRADQIETTKGEGGNSRGH